MRIRYYRSARGDEPVRDYIEEGKLWEIRVGRHRIAYVLVTAPEMVLLHAFKKPGQRTPRRDLDLALRRAKEVLGGVQ